MSTESLDHIPDNWFVEHSGESRVVDYDKVAQLITAARRLINAPHSAARDEAIADIEALLA
jgi:hypothetical protein